MSLTQWSKKRTTGSLNENCASLQAYVQERLGTHKRSEATIMQHAIEWSSKKPEILDDDKNVTTRIDDRSIFREKLDQWHKNQWDLCNLQSGYNHVRNLTDVNKHYSHLWLKVQGLSRSDMKKILLLQDGKGNIKSWLKRIGSSESDACRLCKKTRETVGHVLGGCPRIAFSLLKARHDSVVLMIANMVIVNRKLGPKLTLAQMGKRIQRSQNGFELLLDQRVWCRDGQGVRTSQLPDLITIDQASKRIAILEVAVAAEELIGVKQWEKEDKYRDLATVLGKRYPGYKVHNLQFVIGQLVVVTERSINNLKGFRAIARATTRDQGAHTGKVSLENLMGKIHIVCLKGSLNIYAWFTGRGGNTVEARLAKAIRVESTPRPALPEQFQLKMLEAFGNISRSDTLSLKAS